MRYIAPKSAFRAGTVNKKECLLDDSFTDVKEIGEFKYRYYLRHGDNGSPLTIEEFPPCINFWGTVFFKKPLKWGVYGHGILVVRGWSFD